MCTFDMAFQQAVMRLALVYRQHAHDIHITCIYASCSMIYWREPVRLGIDCAWLPRAAARARQTRSFVCRFRVQNRSAAAACGRWSTLFLTSREITKNTARAVMFNIIEGGKKRNRTEKCADGWRNCIVSECNMEIDLWVIWKFNLWKMPLKTLRESYYRISNR